ncbi:MAG: gp53-like domain-containing protein [Caulobacteraceae bacterium]
MKASDQPPLISTLWASGAGAAYTTTVPVASQQSTTPGAASFTDGFPPLNDTPVAAGGVPPRIQDFNGVLAALTAQERWASVGYPTTFNAAFVAAVGGYPAGARINSTTPGVSWINTIDANTGNPDAGAAGWIPAAGYFGTVTLPATSTTSTSANVTFPTPFPTACLFVGLVGVGPPSASQGGALILRLQAGSPTASGFSVEGDTNTGGISGAGQLLITNAVTVLWEAMGR